MRVIDLADADSQAEPCLMPKPAAVCSKRKAPSFSSRPGLQSGGVTSGHFIKEVCRHSVIESAACQCMQRHKAYRAFVSAWVR